MPYRYLAYDSSGTKKTGTLLVDREETAEQILHQRGLTIAKLTRINAAFDLIKWFPTFFGPKQRDVIVFSNQLANLVESGVALLTGLDLLAEEVSSKPLRKVLQQVVEDIRQGSSISAALAKHDLVFPPIYQSMIQVGERTGNLGGVLRQLSIHLEKESNIKSKIKGAMAYPAVVLALAFGVILLLLNFTLPPLLALYTEFDAQLPWPTRFLMGVTESFLQYRIHLLIGFIVLLAMASSIFEVHGERNNLPICH